MTNSTVSANTAGNGGSGGSAGSAGSTSIGGTGGSGGFGGGILNAEALSVINSTVGGNAAGSGGSGGGAFGGGGGRGGSGGGIFNLAGAATLTDATVAANRAGTGGGGASNFAGGSGGAGGVGGGIAVGITSLVTLSNTTVAGNTGGGGASGGDGPESAGGDGDGGGGGSGGGMFICGAGFVGGMPLGGTLSVTNATISANAVGAGGAAGSGGANNGAGGSAGVGGGIAVQSGGAATEINTLVASNGLQNCAGAITDGAHNLSYPDSTCPGISGDPDLGQLQNNGGPTQTMALGPGSAAVDRIPASGANCPPTDQRGVPRPQPSGGLCDIGAYELASVPVCQPVAVNTSLDQPVTVQLDCVDGAGAPLTYAIDTSPAHGALGTLDPSTGQVTYAPKAGYSGPDSFSYHAAGANGVAASQTVSITVRPSPPPACENLSVSTSKNRAVAVRLSCADPAGRN